VTSRDYLLRDNLCVSPFTIESLFNLLQVRKMEETIQRSCVSASRSPLKSIKPTIIKRHETFGLFSPMGLKARICLAGCFDLVAGGLAAASHSRESFASKLFGAVV
jgi:hypothetical protein